MAAITFQWDSKELAFWQSNAPEKAVARAASKAGNDALRAMRTAAGRSVRQRKKIKAGVVSKAFKLNYASPRSSLESMEWSMDVTGAPMPLIAFPHSQTRRGVSVMVNAGSRKLVKGAFIATMKSGHEGVFVRTGKARLPIKELFSTRVTDVFKDEGMIPAVFARTQSVFTSAFQRLLNLELGKGK